MVKIPLTPWPNQELQTDLDDQMCTLRVYERAGFMYLDLTVGSSLIASGMLCLPTTPVLPDTITGFSGNFYVVDMLAASGATQAKPSYTGWGTRWQLCYLTAAELAELKAEKNG